jgi:hypothetical protein
VIDVILAGRANDVQARCSNPAIKQHTPARQQ